MPGKPYIISVDDGVDTVYMDPDTQKDAAPQRVQIWDYDPVNPKYSKQVAQTMQWHFDYNKESLYYSIRLGPSKQNALAYKNATGNYDGLLWILKYDPLDKTQHWYITRLPDSAVCDTYVISSATDPQYGLIRQYKDKTDTFVKVKRMWGGHTPIFGWYIVPAPDDLLQ